MADQNASKYWIRMNHLTIFLMIFNILDDESTNTTFRTFRNKKNGGTNMADQNLKCNYKVVFWFSSGKITVFLRQCYVILFY